MWGPAQLRMETAVFFTRVALYFNSPQPIRPKEASDSDFTIEDVMLWPRMRFSLRSQCKRCFAGRLHIGVAWLAQNIRHGRTRVWD